MSDTQKFLINLLALLVIGAVVARLTVLELVVIDTNAMAPTLVYGDEVLVLTTSSPDMADILVCEHPLKPGVPVVGRAIAFAGHTVRTDNRGGLYVDDDRVTMNFESREFTFYDVVRGNQYIMQIGEVDYFGRHDHSFMRTPDEPLNLRATTVKRGVYLLGDNRREWTLDSRKFGEVDLDTCFGEVLLRWRPAPHNGDDVDNGMLELIR